MRHFLFEDKPYRINPRFKRLKRGQDSARALARLLKRLTPGKGRGGPKGGRGIDARQKCVVKVNYSNSIEAHRFQLERYLTREGTGIDGGRPELYGTDPGEYRDNMADRNFRIFLSPQSDQVDLRALTEEFVRRLEQQTGYRLYWQAANHYNTAHPHAHLLINGRARDGREVTIPPDIVRTFMREYARDICTEQIGNRTRAEIALDRERELEAGRHTRIDDHISYLCDSSLRVNLTGVSDRERVLARLENLRRMDLCEYRDGAYHLSPHWEDDLRANGRYNTFLRARSELQYTNPDNLRVYTGEQGAITGRVTRIYRPDDDTSNNYAAIIESSDGHAYFVPLLRSPEMYVDGSRVRLTEGEDVDIRTYENQRGRLTPVIFRRR